MSSMLRSFVPILLAAATGCSARRQVATPIAPDLAVQTFDAAWSIIHRTHFDTTFNGVNWLALKDELRPRAQAARTTPDLRRVLAEMVSRLGQSHFSLIPQEVVDGNGPRDTAAVPGTAGFDVRWIEDGILVTSVEADGPAARAGVRPGWELTKIDATAAAELVAGARRSPLYPLGTRVWIRVAARLAGAPGDVRRLEFRDDAGRLRAAQLPAAFDRLPNGDVLFHAIGDFTTATGVVLEGRGVIPDEVILVTRGDLLAGRDPVLEAAVQWIAAQRKP